MFSFAVNSISHTIDHFVQIGGFMILQKKALLKGLITLADCTFNYTRYEQQLLADITDRNSVINSALSDRGDNYA